MKPKVILLYSPIPQSGKSTVADYLYTAHKGMTISFSQPIKEVVGTLVDYVGGDMFVRNKEARYPQFGNKTVRYMLQTLGTEWGRNLINEDIWVELAIARVKEIYDEENSDYIVIDDCRFMNEYYLMKRAFDTTTIKIVRPGHEYDTGGHSSEGQLNDSDFDYTIINDSTVNELYLKVDAIMKEIKGE